MSSSHFHQLSHSRAETRDDPQYANGSKHEACSEYEREIEYASFQNLHNGCFGDIIIVHLRICAGISVCRESCRGHVAKIVANLSQKSMPLSPQTVKQIVRLPFGQEQSSFDHLFQVPLKRSTVDLWT